MHNDHRKYTSVLGLRTCYDHIEGPHPILILHGWGSSIDAWITVSQRLKEHGFGVTAVDLPGFGETDPPPSAWSVQAYADFVLAFLQVIALRPYVLLGHSFGGRIAIVLASQPSSAPEALVLTGSAGVPPVLSLRQKAVSQLATLGRAILPPTVLDRSRRAFYRITRVRDQTRLRPVMRETMNLVVRQDLTPLLSKITTPTLLAWGADDVVTPVADGELMHRVIRSSRYAVIPNTGHRAPYERAEVFVGLVTAFLQELLKDPKATR
jgi:pimeloyl-ACP methyl ester carboxylesterase